METARPADAYTDYRFFRFLTLNGARLVVSCLFLVGWNLLFFRQWDTVIFLGSTGFLALVVSLAAGMAAYFLYKRRGGRVEKTAPPPL